MQTLMFNRLHKASLISAAILGMSATQNFALADDVLAERFADTPYVATADLPALGSVPTFYVNLDPITMATYLRMDREEGRKHFDKSKPSLLDPYITKMHSMPVGGSSRNGFSQINPHICITVVNATIPSWNDPVIGLPASYNNLVNASRVCSDSYPVPMGRNTAELTAFYTANGAQLYNNTTHKVQILMVKGQTPSGVHANPEPATGWGIAYFSTNGSQGYLEEVVWVNATYSMN